MAEKEKLRVELCMGSSCFARGNSTILMSLEELVEQNGLAGRIDLEGHLCLGKCNSGPHIKIGETEYSGISDPEAVFDLIRKALEG
ncbi:MAG: (2Fe-2S) ferredoxin domain-containing protein [Spirochaetes bacterium]|uniref:(2Fe-2S) ferredoxin domain-containing protein n=1 Tax=Candidatus Ornithospirochaeta stercoripullorum TaxID=2840899 RepID=A0A9D9E0H1_9SPIO|nr:(2Fe-2S) ferredoxin domain-containing protein [Candidatus Ornithospirochaeta stercoripullorum]